MKRCLFERSGCVTLPFKLVQRGAIHHAERCQWGTAASAGRMGLAEEMWRVAARTVAPLLFNAS